MSTSMAATQLNASILYHVVNTLGWPSLRPLQEQAVAAVMRGDDALLIAPTAGGKTEAALFPLLSRMDDEDWNGLSVLYVCPLRAMLNNLEPRVASYAAWLGRRAQVRHGDTPAGERRLRGIGDPLRVRNPNEVSDTIRSGHRSRHRSERPLVAPIREEAQLDPAAPPTCGRRPHAAAAAAVSVRNRLSGD